MKESIFSQCKSRNPSMPAPSNEILLVTPVWNDSVRLMDFGQDLAEALAKSPLPVRWVIADDGSEVEEDAALNELQITFGRMYPRVELHFANAHRGKGLNVVSDVQLYLDLYNYPLRGREQAEHLYNKRLSLQFEG